MTPLKDQSDTHSGDEEAGTIGAMEPHSHWPSFFERFALA